MRMSDNTVLLSFILPVYNVEFYLQECIESILSEATDQCEIILVNDGSTDSSGEICSKFAENSKLIHFINKENGGLSSARNVGLSVAKGRYVTFVDSDDKIFPETVSNILHWIQTEGTDLCFLQSVKIYPDGSQVNLGEGIVRAQIHKKKKEEAIQYLASRPKYPGSAWGKLYRRDFLVDNNLHFPFDRRYSEDLGFIRDCILHAQSIDALEIPFYQYRQNRPGSITYRVTAKNFHGVFLFISESVDQLTVNKKPKDAVSRYIMNFVAYEYAILLYIYSKICTEDKRAELSKLREFKWTLKYAGNTKGYLVLFLCTVFGIRFTSFLLSQFRKARNQ